MDHWHLKEANETIAADLEFHALRKKFEADVQALMNKQHPDSEIRGIMEDFINLMDDAYADTIEVAVAEAENVQSHFESNDNPTDLSQAQMGLRTGRMR